MQLYNNAEKKYKTPTPSYRGSHSNMISENYASIQKNPPIGTKITIKKQRDKSATRQCAETEI